MRRVFDYRYCIILPSNRVSDFRPGGKMSKWLEYFSSPDFIIGVVVFGLIVNLVINIVYKRIESTISIHNKKTVEKRYASGLFLSQHPEKLWDRKLRATKFGILSAIYSVGTFLCVGFSLTSIKSNTSHTIIFALSQFFCLYMQLFYSNLEKDLDSSIEIAENLLLKESNPIQ